MDANFTIRERAEFLGNKKIKPIDRSDRESIDNWNLVNLWKVRHFVKIFTDKAYLIRTKLNLPDLKVSEDITKGAVFGQKRLYIGVRSIYLDKHPDMAKKLEKMIYTYFLKPFNWSYNFYPFIEYFVLYEKRTHERIKPNPLLLNLILTKKTELGRNKYTKSDIEFLKQRARVLIGATSERSTKKQSEDIKIIEMLLRVRLDKEKPPRHLAFKALCFDVFNDINKDKSIYLTKNEKQYNQYLKAFSPELVDLYNDLFKYEISAGIKKPLTEKQAYMALKRYHSEYKNILKLK